MGKPKSRALTNRSIQGTLIAPGKNTATLSDKTALRGNGRLILRVTRNSSGTEVKKWFFKFRYNQQTKLHKIGFFPSLDLTAARAEADKLSAILQRGENPVIAVREQQREAVIASTTQANFKELLDKYLTHLEGKASHKTVSGNFQKHVRDKFPQLLRLPANEVTPSHISSILREMRLSGCTALCNRVRSQLSAAFNFCRRVDNDWRLDQDTSLRFNINENPVAVTAPDEKLETERDRSLTRGELIQYWRGIEALENKIVLKAFFKLHLLLMGQRPEQLLRLQWSDVNFEEKTLTLINTKDRDRPHLLPLKPAALQVLKTLKAELKTQWHKGSNVFPGRRGYTFTDKPLHIGSVSRAFKMLVDELGIRDVQLRDIRRTAKTLGASIIKLETMDRIQMHSVGSKVSRRYNRHDYFEQKEHGLNVWESFLAGFNQEPIADNVLPISKTG